jgi:Uma2 family endonuclease
MAIDRRPVTAAELAMLPDDGVRREIAHGEVVIMSPTGGRHGRVAAEIAYRLTDFNKRNGRPGEVLVGDVGVLLQRDPDTLRAPDVGFFLQEHLPGGEVPVGFFEGVAPDVVVEVISPSDRPGEVLAKAAEWRRGGAKIVWLVDPEAERVLVLQAGRDLRAVQSSELLTAEPVLPGFSVLVSELFS